MYTFAKGEWKIRGNDIIFKGSGAKVAEIETGWPKDEVKCHANLISAAPDMYEALKDLIDSDDCSLDHHGHCQTHGWLQPGLCPQFRAKLAINKAEGR